MEGNTLSYFIEKTLDNQIILVEAWGDSTYVRENGLAPVTFQKIVRSYYNNRFYNKYG